MRAIRTVYSCLYKSVVPFSQVRGDARFKVKEKAVPLAVFQKAGVEDPEAAQKAASLGAMERLKGKKGKGK